MRYNSYANYFRELYGSRVQKLSINAGFTCPNRDGSLSRGGCIFCNNDAFNPSYCMPEKSIRQQLDEGIEFHLNRYPNTRHYLAYFQAYSNTYASLDILKSRYEEALSHPLVVGIVIGTRPDCIDEQKLDYIQSLAKTHYMALEYGIESCYDDTLLAINRGHDFAATRWAVQATADRGIHCGGHLILGLPGDTYERIIDEASIINQLPLNSIKLHQLQILKGSTLEHMPQRPAQYPLDQYIALVCDFVERLRPDIAIERFAGEVPPRYQACPERSWRRADGRLIRNEEIPQMVQRELQRRDSFQGCRITPGDNHCPLNPSSPYPGRTAAVDTTSHPLLPTFNNSNPV